MLIMAISKLLFEKGAQVFHFCLLSKTKLSKRVAQLFVIGTPSVLLRKM